MLTDDPEIRKPPSQNHNHFRSPDNHCSPANHFCSTNVSFQLPDFQSGDWKKNQPTTSARSCRAAHQQTRRSTRPRSVVATLSTFQTLAPLSQDHAQSRALRNSSENHCARPVASRFHRIVAGVVVARRFAAGAEHVLRLSVALRSHQGMSHSIPIPGLRSTTSIPVFIFWKRQSFSTILQLLLA